MLQSHLIQSYKILEEMLTDIKAKKEYSAFTLAEVLITLGIIGVVAALTIPTVIANVRGTIYKSQFKKTLSNVNQGVRMSQAKWNLDFTLRGFSSHSKAGAGPGNYSSDPEVEISQYPIFSATMQGEWDKSACRPGNSYGVCEDLESDLLSYVSSGMKIFRFLDGSEIYVPDVMEGMTSLYFGKKGCTKENANMLCYGWIDVNGYKKGPNKEIRCSDGSRKLITESDYIDCTVDSDDMTDIYPVWFHDAVVEPLTNASKYALLSK